MVRGWGGGGCREPVPRTLGLADNAMSLIGKKRLFFSDLMASPTPVGVIFILKTTVRLFLYSLRKKNTTTICQKAPHVVRGEGVRKDTRTQCTVFLGGQYQPEEVNLSL